MAADATYPSTFQVRQDGNAVVPTGKSLDIESGGVFAIAGTTVSATAADLNRVSAASRYAVDTAVQTLVVADLNKVHFLNSATEFVTTLPAVASSAGYWATFIVKAAPSGASYTVVTASSENKVLGHVLTSQDAGGSADSETSGGDTITFVDGKAVVGDRVDLECDGAFWYVRASSKVFDAITITTAS